MVGPNINGTSTKNYTVATSKDYSLSAYVPYYSVSYYIISVLKTLVYIRRQPLWRTRLNAYTNMMV